MSATALAGSRQTAKLFDVAATRSGLRALELGGLSISSAPEQDYFAFYGIDFENRIRGVIHHFGRAEAAGFDIACHYYEVPQPRGTCVLLHGYFDHAGLYGHLIEHCLRSGNNVLIWDLPGHGLSNGEPASIHSFEHYIDVMAAMLELYGERLPRPLHGIGQSTGSAILMGWAFRGTRACMLQRITLLAPLVRPAKWRRVRLLHTLVRPIRNSLARRFMRNSSDEAFLDFVQLDPLQCRVLPVRWVSAMREWVHEFAAQPPVEHAPLVIQGSIDETVDWKWNLQKILEKFPKADVRMVRGAGHHLVNESQALRSEVFAMLGLG